MCKIDALNAFSHLHCHTATSQDGLNTSYEIAARAKELGMRYIANTDHGSLANLVNHKIECDANGVTPIFGIEGYTTINSLTGSGKVKANHITILARNKVGYENLIALNNVAHRQIFAKGAIKFPLMFYKDMKQYREGLTVLTGCPASLTYHEDYDQAANYVETLINIFGDENVFAELMMVMDGHDFHSRPIQLAAEFGIETVITNDSHFVKEGDDDIQMICNRIRSRAKTGTDYSYDSTHLWLKSAEEMWDRATQFVDEEIVERSFLNIKTITDKIEPFEIKKDPVLPLVDDEKIEKFKDLVKQFHKEYKQKNPELAEIADARFEKEYNIINDFNYWHYFYIVNDIVYFCLKNDRFVTCRGSAGSFYIIYLLKFFDVDPIKYDLIPERFLNPARKDFPDIDVDIDDSFRGEVLSYCKDKWGLEKVNTVSTFGHKMLINDLARELKLTNEVKNMLHKCENGDEPEWLEYRADNPLFARAYDGLIDKQRSIGKHAAAVCSILDDTPFPIEAFGEEPGIAYTESGSSKDLSYVGGVKFDLLGSTTLATLFHMFKLTGVKPPDDIDKEFPARLYADGDTIGLMQFDGSVGIKQLCIDIKPTGLNESATINALHRPGPLNAGMTKFYKELKENGGRKFHPEVDKILASTYSVIVFQEQVMSIYEAITKSGLEGADLARRIISVKSPKKKADPKWQKEIVEVKQRFLDAPGFPQALKDQLWEELEFHSGYSFNKTHSIGYAKLAARQGWYKINYPTEFYLATLSALQAKVNKTGGGKSKMQDYLWGITGEGLTVRPPHILYSTETFGRKDDVIYMPITLLKQVTKKSLEAVDFLKETVEYNKDDELDYVVAPLFANSENDDSYFEKVEKRFAKFDKAAFDIDAETLKALSIGHVLNKAARANIAKVGGYEGVDGDHKLLYDMHLLEENEFKRQTDAMGMIVPNEWYHKVRAHFAEKEDVVFGVVLSKENKTTRNGNNYIMYKLTDNQVLKVWINMNIELPVGTPVAAVVNKWKSIVSVDKKPQYEILYP